MMGILSRWDAAFSFRSSIGTVVAGEGLAWRSVELDAVVSETGYFDQRLRRYEKVLDGKYLLLQFTILSSVYRTARTCSGRRATSRYGGMEVPAFQWR